MRYLLSTWWGCGGRCGKWGAERECGHCAGLGGGVWESRWHEHSARCSLPTPQVHGFREQSGVQRDSDKGRNNHSQVDKSIPSQSTRFQGPGILPSYLEHMLLVSPHKNNSSLNRVKFVLLREGPDRWGEQQDQWRTSAWEGREQGSHQDSPKLALWTWAGHWTTLDLRFCHLYKE